MMGDIDDSYPRLTTVGGPSSAADHLDQSTSGSHLQILKRMSYRSLTFADGVWQTKHLVPSTETGPLYSKRRVTDILRRVLAWGTH